MILLSFLGTGKYESTPYTWQEKEFQTPYVIEALAEFFQVKEITVFVTKEAYTAHGIELDKQIGKRFKLSYVDIPSGSQEAEIWQIFDKVVESVPPDSEIIFDITHAFRSIPVIVLLASAFLQKANNVNIQGLYYGLYNKTGESPIVDLTPGFKLLDWLTATETFINTGSSQKLGELLSQIQRDFYKQNQGNKTEIQPRKLISFGNSISKLSENIEFIRPAEIIQESNKIKRFSGQDLRDEISIFAKPFELLIDRIERDYAQFTTENDKKPEPKTIIQKHYLLIKWYTEKGLGNQAILLAREWIVTTLTILENLDYLKNRDKVQDQLNEITPRNKQSAQKEINYDNYSISKHVKDPEKLGRIWNDLRNYRNDIAHCGMRNQSVSAQKLSEYAQEIPSMLKNLFPQLDL